MTCLLRVLRRGRGQETETGHSAGHHILIVDHHTGVLLHQFRIDSYVAVLRSSTDRIFRVFFYTITAVGITRRSVHS